MEDAKNKSKAGVDTEKSDVLPAQEISIDGQEDDGSESVKSETEKNEVIATEQQEEAANTLHTDDKVFSIYTHNEKRLLVLCGGICAFFSPTSSQVYYPSLNVIARDLNVSNTLVNLTITTYIIMQGISPTFVAGLSDTFGRRIAYLVSFVIYMAATIGLGIQSSYPALLVLRCIQSAGSSPTVALANAVAADVVPPQERGMYVSYMSIAPQVGPALGPVIGGLLARGLGWHSVFWFLLIVAGVVATPMAFFFPETCRNIVEDGSVPPPEWSRCLANRRFEARMSEERRAEAYARRDELASARRLRFPNLLDSVRILFTKEAGFALAFIGVLCCGMYATMAVIPSQFGRVYGFNEIQIGLCYIPLGVGAILSVPLRGRAMDKRFAHHAKRLGISIERNKPADLVNFPIERARLEVGIPTIILAAGAVIAFGWMVDKEVNLAGPLIAVFAIGFGVSASINTVSTLLVDVFPGRSGAASAANNLSRCLVGAAGTGFVNPLIEAIGIGWTGTFFGLLIVAASPILWYIMINGPKWRAATAERKKRKDAEKAQKADNAV